MFRTLKFSLLFCVLCNGVYSQAQNTIQRKQLFDFDWKFYLGETTNASDVGFNDKTWRKLDLPHDWSIEGTLDLNNPMGNDGGYFPAGIGWYRKTFTVPASWNGKQVSIYFEGVYMNSEVFINGKSLGIHPYGYTSFGYDLTPYLNIGSENTLSVKVDNSQQKNSRWYSGSGIYRHVWMIVTNPIHVAQWGVTVTTPTVTPDHATVQIKTRIQNETNIPQSITVKTLVVGANAKKSGYHETTLIISANSEQEVEQAVQVLNPLLWTLETPQLYQAQVQLLKGKQVVDDTKTGFGIRSIKFTTEKGFQLNGKTVKLNGGCVHHDNGCLGAAAFDRAEERRVELLKSAGFNAIRTSHNPPSEAFLDACDRLGMLVIDESFDGWREKKNDFDYAIYFDAWWQRDIEAMVQRDRNHPSIILWSIGNEVLEHKKPEAVKTAKLLADCVRKNDPTRPITSAVTTWDREWEIFDPLFSEHDIAGYNYRLFRAPIDHDRVPTRIILQTESYPRDAYANWKLVHSYPYILGDFVWTALDYLGESGIGRWYFPDEVPKGQNQGKQYPWHGAYCGDIDLIGWRKPISHYRSMLYNENEKLYMAVREPNSTSGKIQTTGWGVWPTWESWTWPGCEGKDIQVEVYSKYPNVRLYLNDKLIGEQATTENQQFKATFTLPYTAGVLKAVGVMESKEVETTVLQTSGNAAAIRLKPDRKILSANGQDLSFVVVEVTDAHGNLQTNADNRLQFNMDGPGVIVGVDNANMSDLDSYVGSSRKAWHGRALVVIRSTKRAGKIKLTVSSNGLTSAVETITTIIK
jgi:beta-galactosidase